MKIVIICLIIILVIWFIMFNTHIETMLEPCQGVQTIGMFQPVQPANMEDSGKYFLNEFYNKLYEEKKDEVGW